MEPFKNAEDFAFASVETLLQHLNELEELPWIPYYVALTFDAAFELRNNTFLSTDYRAISIKEKTIPNTYEIYYRVGIRYFGIEDI